MKAANLFIEAGFESDLYTFEERKLDKIKKIIDYVDSHKKLPSLKSNNKVTKQLATQMYALRECKKGKLGVWYKSCQDLIDKHNAEYIFSSMSSKERYIENIKKISEYYHTYNKLPFQKDADRKIARLGEYITRLRVSKKSGKKSGKKLNYKPYMLDIAISYGLPSDIFDNQRNQQSIDNKIHKDAMEIVEFYYKNNRLPRHNKRNKYEYKLAYRRSRYTRIRNNTPENIDHILSKIESEHKIPSLFSICDEIIQKRIYVFKLIIKYALEFNKYPPQHTKNKDTYNGLKVSKLGRLLNKCRNKSHTCNKEIYDFVSNSPFPNMLNSNWKDDFK